MYKCAVLGSPISHSLSDTLQLFFAKECGIKMQYDKIETIESNLEKTLVSLQKQGYTGLNCTMPLKTKAAELCKNLSDSSRFLTSVNTVVFKEDGIYGDTTDGDGMINAIHSNGISFKNKRILLLGSGGTARSIAYSLLKKDISSLVCIRRHEGLFDLMFKDIEKAGFDKLDKYAVKSDMIINATSLGMRGKDSFENLDFLEKVPFHCHIADVVYNPYSTLFLEKSRQKKLSVTTGLEMLVFQGAKSFEKWTGIIISQETSQKAVTLLKGKIK